MKLYAKKNRNFMSVGVKYSLAFIPFQDINKNFTVKSIYSDSVEKMKIRESSNNSERCHLIMNFEF